MKKLTRGFFEKKPEFVARELLGKILVRQKEGEVWIGKIVETEAYLGLGDKASHSHKGITKRNEVMFGPGGFSYIYFTYGMHWLLNFITEKEGKPSAVLIRAVEPLFESGRKVMEIKKVGSGPARLTKWMEIAGDLSKVDITKSNELFTTDEIKIDGQIIKSEKVSKTRIAAVPRIGVDYAEESKDLPLRFYIKENLYISKK